MNERSGGEPEHVEESATQVGDLKELPISCFPHLQTAGCGQSVEVPGQYLLLLGQCRRIPARVDLTMRRGEAEDSQSQRIAEQSEEIGEPLGHVGLDGPSCRGFRAHVREGARTSRT